MNIAVAGTGYVGLSMATLLSQHNHVMAVDIIPADNDRIRIATIRESNYKEACKVCETLADFNRAVEIPDIVRYMKKIVPEFKSKNSVFEKFDKEIEEGK